jgi:fumarylpyruvate hydrolase
MKYVFEPEQQIAVPVIGRDEQFPVRRVYCVGRNYAAHAREMGFDPDREPPFFFCKPDNSVVVVKPGTTGTIAYPPGTSDYQHEIELVVAIGKSGSNISVEQAPDYVFGYAVGLDMTRRDLQIKSRDKGRPWELGKAFDQSAPISSIYPVAAFGHPKNQAISLMVDGTQKQKSDLSNLIWSVPEVVMHLSQFFTLQPGDLIYTGTPEGVGKVIAGQTMLGEIEGLGQLHVNVIASF